MAMMTADNLGIKKEEVLIASTGVIGRELPIEKIRKGIIDAVEELSYKGSNSAASANVRTPVSYHSCGDVGKVKLPMFFHLLHRKLQPNELFFLILEHRSLLLALIFRYVST
jgi:hypothetical protein